MTFTNPTIPYKPKPTNHKFIDIEGMVFGRLTVMGFVGRSSNNNSLWECRCSCGKVIITRSDSLRRNDNNTLSCGCYHREIKTKHGLSHTSMYRLWRGILSRCLNKKYRTYPRYGGRGIKICERWMEFENFLQDMGERPSGTSLNRINNDGDYSPDNCEWATAVAQANNTASNVNITWKGRTQTIAQWAKELGMHHAVLRYRIDAGWEIDRALTTPARARRKPS